MESRDNFSSFLQQFYSSIVIANKDEIKEKKIKSTKLICIIAIVLFVLALKSCNLPGS